MNGNMYVTTVDYNMGVVSALSEETVTYDESGRALPSKYTGWGVVQDVPQYDIDDYSPLQQD